jgi:hypothetical protein
MPLASKTESLNQIAILLPIPKFAVFSTTKTNKSEEGLSDRIVSLHPKKEKKKSKRATGSPIDRAVND